MRGSDKEVARPYGGIAYLEIEDRLFGFDTGLVRHGSFDDRIESGVEQALQRAHQAV